MIQRRLAQMCRPAKLDLHVVVGFVSAKVHAPILVDQIRVCCFAMLY
jgi:hypothetical protein